KVKGNLRDEAVRPFRQSREDHKRRVPIVRLKLLENLPHRGFELATILRPQIAVAGDADDERQRPGWRRGLLGGWIHRANLLRRKITFSAAWRGPSSLR